MKVLVTGKQGQVARCLNDRLGNDPAYDLTFAARNGTSLHLDLARPDTIRAAVQALKPDIIVSAAAFTAVDLAEDEPDLAMTINGKAPGILAEEAKKCGARLIHISTDYVYDGTLDRAYVETDAVNPIGVYGRSKLAGEQAIERQMTDFVILRTAWVYSPYGKNFKKTMLALAAGRDEISVVSDQIGTPTSAYEIADGIKAVLECWQSGEDKGLGEIFHLAGRQEMSWADFARQIFEESAKNNGPSAVVHSITTAEYPTKAKRPANSRLNSDKFHATFTI